MDDVSEFLLGPQHSTMSGFGIVLAVIAVALAGLLMAYLFRCYIQEVRIRRRVQRRVRQQYGGNIVPCLPALSETRRLRKKSSGILPAPRPDSGGLKLRRPARAPHPWKRKRFHNDSATPH